MKERPILMSSPMVRAYLEGRKTQTRRVIQAVAFGEFWIRWKDGYTYMIPERAKELVALCPYGQVGDRLWFREAWATRRIYDQFGPNELPNDAPIWYLADGPKPAAFGRTRASIHLPRRFTRILIDPIISIRTERLQEISEEDAEAEGCHGTSMPDIATTLPTYRAVFRCLWDTLHPKKDRWIDNLWVWVIEWPRFMSS